LRFPGFRNLIILSPVFRPQNLVSEQFSGFKMSQFQAQRLIFNSLTAVYHVILDSKLAQ